MLKISQEDKHLATFESMAKFIGCDLISARIDGDFVKYTAHWRRSAYTVSIEARQITVETRREAVKKLRNAYHNWGR